MGSDTPIPGRCGARSKRGGFCEAVPAEGKTRCRYHGGTNEGEATGLVHGRYSKNFARISEEAQRQIDEALLDPDLLDVRQGVAVSRVLMQEAPLIPDEEVASAAAKLAKARALAGVNTEGWKPAEVEELLRPTDAEVELARLELLRRSHNLVERHHKRQVDALRQIELGRLMRDQVIPLFQELGLRLGPLIDEFIDDPVKREKFRAAFRAQAKQTVVMIAGLRQAKGKRS